MLVVRSYRRGTRQGRHATPCAKSWLRACRAVRAEPGNAAFAAVATSGTKGGRNEAVVRLSYAEAVPLAPAARAGASASAAGTPRLILLLGTCPTLAGQAPKIRCRPPPLTPLVLLTDENMTT